VDHSDHEALVALDPETRAGVGVARYVRSSDDPEVAEVAVAVSDPWQGLGVGTALLQRLTERARAEGIERFSAEVLAENERMLELAASLGDVSVSDAGEGAVELILELPDEGIGASLRETLRAAGRGLLRAREALTRMTG
jgi:GNAT superfamily N-acetyltransferase